MASILASQNIICGEYNSSEKQSALVECFESALTHWMAVCSSNGAHRMTWCRDMEQRTVQEYSAQSGIEFHLVTIRAHESSRIPETMRSSQPLSAEIVDCRDCWLRASSQVQVQGCVVEGVHSVDLHQENEGGKFIAEITIKLWMRSRAAGNAEVLLLPAFSFCFSVD